MKILAAMSGGVDSSAAAALLLRDGHDVAGGTLRLFSDDAVTGSCGNPREAADARAVCETLGIAHHIIDGRDIFRDCVTRPFVRAYLDGLTPNPCLLCNKRLKFGLLLDWAIERGFDAVATGHYARSRLDEATGRYILLRAVHPEKDQSYALYSLSQHQLAHSLFPLGGMTKAQVRQFAEDAALPTARKPDSQDICFVPDGDYMGFILSHADRAHAQTPPMSGSIVTADGTVIGAHDGIAAYTIGQRKGLGGQGRPVYVLEKDPVTATVTVGPDEALYKTVCRAENVNWIVPPDGDAPFRAAVKTRYTHGGAPAEVRPDGTGAVITFDTPQRALTPGQAAVMYDGEVVVGGGEISQLTIDS